MATIQLYINIIIYRAQLPHSLQGVAINFVREDDVRVLRDIEQYYSTQIDEMVSLLC